MTIFTSALLSLALMFNAPDSAKLTETAEIPCKENYYGYEIDIGEIAGTMVAEELNEYKTEFRDFINNAIKYELKQSDAPQKSNYEYLQLSDIDFNDKTKITAWACYKEYTSYEYNAKYDDVFSEVADTEYYYWFIRKNDTIYCGTLYENAEFYFEPKYYSAYSDSKYTYGYDVMCIGNYKIKIQHIIDDVDQSWLNSYFDINCEYIKQNIGRLLYEKNEKSSNIKALPVTLSKTGPRAIIIFIDETAKYICSDGLVFDLLAPCSDILSADTPEHIKNMLIVQQQKLYFNSDISNYEKLEPSLLLENLMPYNQIMYYMPLVMEWGA